MGVDGNRKGSRELKRGLKETVLAAEKAFPRTPKRANRLSLKCKEDGVHCGRSESTTLSTSSSTSDVYDAPFRLYSREFIAVACTASHWVVAK